MIDVFQADPDHGAGSRAALDRCLSEGRLIACEVVLAEIAGAFAAPAHAMEALRTLEVSFDPVDAEAAMEAGVRFRRYRQQGGQRDRLLADFLVGSHALHQAGRLLTRDRGLFAKYYNDLTVLDPSSTKP